MRVEPLSAPVQGVRAVFGPGVSCFQAGAGPDVVRLSIGLEDKEDIIADLEQGLAA